MLTGDKLETAICIAKSSRLVSRTQQIHVFSAVGGRTEAHLELNAFRRKTDCALIIRGDSLDVFHTSPLFSLLKKNLLIFFFFIFFASVRFASSITSTNSWNWRASVRPSSSVAARPRKRPRSCDYSETTLVSRTVKNNSVVSILFQSFMIKIHTYRNQQIL